MPTPARRSSTGGGGPGRAGVNTGGPPCPGTGPSSRAPPRTGGRGRAGAAGVPGSGLAWPGRGSASPPWARTFPCPSPTSPRVGTLLGLRPCRAGTVARRLARRLQARSDRAAHKGKGRGAGRAIPGRPQSGGGGAGAGARPCQWRGPCGVAKR